MERGTNVYGNKDIQSIMLLPHLQVIVEFLGAVMAHHKRIFGEFLEEAFRCRAVDIKVEGLHWDEQRAQGEDGEE